MRKIKRYANGKRYDTVNKKYLSKDRLSQLIKTGEEIMIIDNKTGEDITSELLTELLPENARPEIQATSNVLMEQLKKGRTTVMGYGKKYISMWQSVLSMAEEEVDKLVKMLVKDEQISESEGGRLKKEIMGYSDNLKNWIDNRINEALGVMNLASKEQVRDLTERIEKLGREFEKLEKKVGSSRKTKAEPKSRKKED